MTIKIAVSHKLSYYLMHCNCILGHSTLNIQLFVPTKICCIANKLLLKTSKKASETTHTYTVSSVSTLFGGRTESYVKVLDF